MVFSAHHGGSRHRRPTSAVVNSFVVREGNPRTGDSHEARRRQIKDIDDHAFGCVANRDFAVQTTHVTFMTTRMDGADS